MNKKKGRRQRKRTSISRNPKGKRRNRYAENLGRSQRKDGEVVWGKLSEVEEIGRLSHSTNLPPQLCTNLGIPNTRSDLAPVALTRHSLFQPPGVILQVILLVGPIRHRPAGALVGDDVGEDDEDDDGSDDEEHGPQVDVHEEGLAIAGAGEARQGDEHDGDSDDDDRPLEEFQAVGGADAGAQPYSAAEDGDGEEEG
ncbi:hypothetical protein U1Q18_020950 [Sarracenia purpurea var. burkii]